MTRQQLVKPSPEVHKAELADMALDQFDAASERAREAIKLTPAGLPPRPEIVRARILQRQRALHVALARVGAVLSRIEGPR